MALPTNSPPARNFWHQVWQRWFAPQHTFHPPSHLPPGMQGHYRQLAADVLHYQHQQAQVQSRIRRNKSLMQEAVRLRVQFAQSASYRERAEIFDRVVVMLNQQVEALHKLDTLYNQALSDLEAQLALLDSTLYAAMETLNATWIPDLVHWQAQVDSLETELAARRIFSEGNLRTFPKLWEMIPLTARQSLPIINHLEGGSRML